MLPLLRRKELRPQRAPFCGERPEVARAGLRLAAGVSPQTRKILLAREVHPISPLVPSIFRLEPLDPRIERFADVMRRHHASELLALDLKPLGDRRVQRATAAKIREAVSADWPTVIVVGRQENTP